jgi:hypothetical protein
MCKVMEIARSSVVSDRCGREDQPRSIDIGNDHIDSATQRHTVALLRSPSVVNQGRRVGCEMVDGRSGISTASAIIRCTASIDRCVMCH